MYPNRKRHVSKGEVPLCSRSYLIHVPRWSAIGLVLGAAVVYYGGWQWVFYSAIPFALIFFFLLWKFIPKDSVAPPFPPPKNTENNDKVPRRHGRVIDIPGVITMVLAICTFMLSITFLGKGKDYLDLFWIFLGIGIVSLRHSL